MELQTKFVYEKQWMNTSYEEALKLIEKEMPETDNKAILSYIINEVKKGKKVTLGECSFKKQRDL